MAWISFPLCERITILPGIFPWRLVSGKIVGNPEEWNSVKDKLVFSKSDQNNTQQRSGAEQTKIQKQANKK
ncbi:hypothetical protein HAX54_033702, partial [Datura stramonium]|nr:hypothetical protein [Datura stramonium]